MALSLSSISGRVYPAWQSAFQASLEESILHRCELFKHLWKGPSCIAVSFSSISGRSYPAWHSAFQASLEESILHGSQLFKHLWKSLSCMAVSFSSISGKVYPAWQSAFQASLEESILHGVFQPSLGKVYPAVAVRFSKHLWKESFLHGSELFKHLWKGPILHGSQLFKHLWKSLSCMAVSFSSISTKHGSELIKISILQSLSCPAWQWQSAFQASLEESILHGSQLFKHFLEESILHGNELLKHLWKSLPCMASISGRVYPAWQ